MHRVNWKRVMSQIPSEVTGRSYIGIRAAGINARKVEGMISPKSASDFYCRTMELAEFDEARWYVAYTRPRHEKAVAEQFHSKGVESFLPLFETMRSWKNGEHLVHMPLFPGYVFARFALAFRLPVLQVQGVVRLVGFNGTPTALKDSEVESLRVALESGVSAEPHPYLAAGRRVRITSGPLAGRVGIMVRRQGAVRVVLSIDLIQRSVLVDVVADGLEPA